MTDLYLVSSGIWSCNILVGSPTYLPLGYAATPGLPGLMTPCCPQSSWSCCCSDLFTGDATLSRTCCFWLSLPHLLSLTLNVRLWKANWHLLLRCWPVAPSTTTVIIIIWPCWSPMKVWTSWPCTVISTRHSQKRTGHPLEPGSSLGFFLGSCPHREFS